MLTCRYCEKPIPQVRIVNAKRRGTVAVYCGDEHLALVMRITKANNLVRREATFVRTLTKGLA